MSTQTELFDDDPELPGLLDQMNHMLPEELTRRWPERLAELVQVLQAELVRNGIEAEHARLLASKCTGAMAHYMGGRAVYIPNGERLREALRDNMIYAQYSGDNIDELSRRYSLSAPAIYRIVAQQKRIYMRRYQADLFGENV